MGRTRIARLDIILATEHGRGYFDVDRWRREVRGPTSYRIHEVSRRDTVAAIATQLKWLLSGASGAMISWHWLEVEIFTGV